MNNFQEIIVTIAPETMSLTQTHLPPQRLLAGKIERAIRRYEQQGYAVKGIEFKGSMAFINFYRAEARA